MKTLFIILCMLAVASCKKKEITPTCSYLGSNSEAFEPTVGELVGLWVKTGEYTKNCSESSVSYTADTLHIVYLAATYYDKQSEADYAVLDPGFGKIRISYNTGLVEYDVWQFNSSSMLLQNTATGYWITFKKQ